MVPALRVFELLVRPQLHDLPARRLEQNVIHLGVPMNSRRRLK